MGFVYARTPLIFVAKTTMIALLSYLLYIAVTCPCDPFPGCHRRQMYTALAACALLILALNGPHFYNTTEQPS
jgi:hypothetical protein